MGDELINAAKVGKRAKSFVGIVDGLAGKIGEKWEKLGLRLGICRDVLGTIAANARDKPLQMLLHWKNTTPSATLYRDLYNPLCHDRVGLNQVAKEFCGKETA